MGKIILGLISYVASSELLYPFDSLPVKLGLQQQKLLPYSKLDLLARILRTTYWCNNTQGIPVPIKICN